MKPAPCRINDLVIPAADRPQGLMVDDVARGGVGSGACQRQH